MGWGAPNRLGGGRASILSIVWQLTYHVLGLAFIFFFFNYILSLLGMVAHACNPIIPEPAI